MISFKEFYNIIEEKSFPNELYHVTNHYAVAKMIKDDCIKLTFANFDSADSRINEDKYFYFSMSYDKWGRYANIGDSDLKSMVGSTNCIVVLDAHAMQSRGKLIDVDYWESEKYKDDEREVRFISDKQKLCDISKFIKEVHVYVNQRTTFSNEKYQHLSLIHI